MGVLRTDLLDLIARTTRAFIAEPSSALDIAIGRTLEAIGTLFQADRAYVFLESEQPGFITNSHEWCAPGVEPQIEHLQALPVETYAWWMAEMRAGRAIKLSCLDELPPQAVEERLLLESQNIQSLLVLPLVRRGHLDGFAGFDHVRGSRFWSDEEIAVLRIVVNSFAQGLERRLIDRRLEAMAFEDALTGLPNRVLLRRRLDEALEQVRRSSRMLAVGYLDLDAFKQINDSHGHAVGDELLRLIADRLRSCLNPGDTAGRLGGDEFVVILPEREHPDQLLLVGESLLAAIAEPFTIGDGVRVAISTSLGFRFVPPDDADADMLLRQADQAMYAAKRAGRGGIHVFDVSLDRSEQERRESIRTISTALARGEMCLHMQPMVDLRSGRTAFVEALVRWQHPVRGLLMPGHWLQVIEDQPEIAELGRWVLDQAMDLASRWIAAGLCDGVSVNVSPLELEDARFEQRLADLLRRHAGMPPGALRLEVVETSAIARMDRLIATMGQCRDLGVSFALDDFGTGYSSLTHMRQLPVSCVKVDRSFVARMIDDPADRTIVRSVIELAHAFDRNCVAEGVETQAQIAWLSAMNCDLLQGYGIAKPMAPQDLENWLRSRDIGGAAEWADGRQTPDEPGSPPEREDRSTSGASA